MSFWAYIFASARHYAKAHLGLLFGVFLASAILSGSLLVGDSVKASLRRVAALRLGNIRSGMLGGERWFTENLARKSGNVPMIIANGSITAASGSARVNAAQVLGIDDTFWRLSPSGKTFALKQDEVLINAAMAAKLNAKTGDAVVIRLEKPSALSRDAPLSGSTTSDITLRRTVAGIVSAEDFGAFQLIASQLTPDTVFVPLSDLQKQVEMDGRCNALMSRATGAGSVEIAKNRTLADFGLKLAKIASDKPEWELSTDRVFMDDTVSTELLKSLPQASGVLTYLVNAITSAGGSTPYSMVTGFAGDEAGITVSQWLAEDQKLKIGDEVKLRYFVVGVGHGLKEETVAFKVSGILPMSDPRVNRSWMPNFPGIANVDSSRDWDAGFPIDKKAIRDKDEDYWKQFKGTPKAFLSLGDAQKLWGNRFGKLTAIRFAGTGKDEPQLNHQIAQQLSLEDIGLTVRDFKTEADAAAQGSVDFGGLFVGLSMFLIAAALVFAALLFVFLIERRASQAGLLLAVGWTPALVRQSLLLEAGVIALIGSGLGLLGGVAYTKAALAGLRGAWGGATAGLPLVFDAQPVTLIIAFVAAFGIAMMTLWWMTRRLLKAPPRVLLSGAEDLSALPRAQGGTHGRLRQACSRAMRGLARITAPLALIGAIVLVIIGRKLTNPEELAGAFFGAGALVMTAALLFFKQWMNKQSQAGAVARSVWQLGLRNVTRRPGRSLAILGMMAGGIFLVVAVNAFRLSASQDMMQRDSGTGGFALIGESSLPVYEDLNTKAGRDAFGLDEEDTQGANVISFRVRPGDDASCLNLNRAQIPQLVGVNTAKLADMKAFVFADGSWASLESGMPLAESVIPAACDQATAMWGLQKGVGDIIAYDLGGGKKLRVKLAALLAGSVLQGKVIVDERAFVQQLPDVSGYRFFLVDAPAGKAREISETLTRQLQPRGLALEPATRRLAAFSAVQNTYISIFTVLGGLGVLLGTAGIGVLILRHVMERKGELGVMQAVGFLPSTLRSMIVEEHAVLLIAGVVVGAVSAAIAVWPSLAQSARDLPLGFIGSLMALILACGLVVCFASSAAAMRGRLLDAVRRE